MGVFSVLCSPLATSKPPFINKNPPPPRCNTNPSWKKTIHFSICSNPNGNHSLKGRGGDSYFFVGKKKGEKKTGMVDISICQLICDMKKNELSNTSHGFFFQLFADTSIYYGCLGWIGFEPWNSKRLVSQPWIHKWTMPFITEFSRVREPIPANNNKNLSQMAPCIHHVYNT